MTILVIGGTGLVGSRVVQALSRRDLSVRATSRKAAAFPAGIEGAIVDLADPATLRDALNGVTAVFAYTEPETAPVLAEELSRAGVRRLVLLSSEDALHESERSFNSRRHREPERTIEQSGLEWTFLRPTAFASNALFWKEQIRHTATVRSPYPEAAQALIDPLDIAECAAVAFNSEALIGEAPVLTGPESLRQRRQVEIIAEVIGKPVAFQPLGVNEARAMFSRFMPSEFVELKLAVLAAAEARPGMPTNSVFEITGRPPRRFCQWAEDNVDAFR
ncbi:NAD(P)H-binding protein [Martelella endophytica]|uniref:NAD(P)-binding domain-containing protein n=1 Tax=Martelella endophytica TaxID=1486262 RepID=A0A0D5LP59_MAREN|nr:NAD(P)H-binding protein [Martelella endophytica]AJY45103.1 hypothetical protein TM49_04400 [Martelella endophytica]